VILLDTHTLVWLAEGHADLGRAARAAADEALEEGALAVSAISFWEIAMLHVKGRIRLVQPLEAWRKEVLELGVSEIPVTGDIGIAAATLDGFYADPADRIIVATASLRRATLLTADERILAWKGPLRSRDARR
jgi:PIN domain nuclease of toxin-antitoxin system